MIPYCSGHARDVKTARCSSCGLDTHLYCQGSGLEQEEEELVTCLMCEARGGGGKDANELRALVHKKLLKKATKNILASTNKLRELEGQVQEPVNTMMLECPFRGSDLNELAIMYTCICFWMQLICIYSLD